MARITVVVIKQPTLAYRSNVCSRFDSCVVSDSEISVVNLNCGLSNTNE